MLVVIVLFYCILLTFILFPNLHNKFFNTGGSNDVFWSQMGVGAWTLLQTIKWIYGKMDDPQNGCSSIITELCWNWIMEYGKCCICKLQMRKMKSPASTNYGTFPKINEIKHKLLRWGFYFGPPQKFPISFVSGSEIK